MSMQSTKRNKQQHRFSLLLTAVLAAVLLSLTVAGTIAYLHTYTEDVENAFTPGSVPCSVSESFTPSTGVKQNVFVTNGGNVPAYIRVKLVPYWCDNKTGDIVSKAAWTPDFEPGSGWVLHDGFYYYTSPVSAGDPTENLINTITLTIDQNDGSLQALDIIAESIQAEGVDAQAAKAVVKAWGVDPTTLGTAG